MRVLSGRSAPLDLSKVGFYGVAFIGGFVEQLGGFAGISSMRTIGVLVSLVSPADSMWRLAAHHMEPDIVRSTGMLALGASSVPSPLMVWWAAGFTVLTLALRDPRVPPACVVAPYAKAADGEGGQWVLLWSAQDNFAWICGYGTRFGIVYVDFTTRKRTPKLTAQWFRETARRNAVV